MKKYILGLDQGTTGTTALLFDDKWNLVSSGYQEIVQSYPAPGLVEQDGKMLYDTILTATDKALKNINASAEEIKCIGIDNQGETIILWNKRTGQQIYPAIVWQDKRTAEEANELNEKYGDLFYSHTSLRMDSYFGATKIRWVLRNVPEARELANKGQLAAGTLDTWLIWNLTGRKEFVTDCVTASRTCLLNINTLTWDREILDLLEIPLSILPEIRENASFFGKTSPDEFFGASIPITASITDQQAALLGQGCFSSGSIKTTYGTGSFLLANTGDKLIKSDSGLISTLAYVHNGKKSFALEGGAYIAGAAVNWLKNGLKIIQNPSDSDKLAQSVPNNGGVYFVPAFAGLSAPYWDSSARGMIIGITSGTTDAHIARATLESIAYHVKDIFDIICKETQTKVPSMRVDGGSTASEFLMQFQSDILNKEIEIPKIRETTGLGSAYLAALSIGEIDSFEQMGKLWKSEKIYTPKMSEDERCSLMHQWHKAIERSKNWAE